MIPFDSTPHARLFLFGAFRLEANERVIVLPARKSESLLAYLVLHPKAHTREKLAALLWGEVPDELARGSLRKALTHLRAALGDDLLLTDRRTVQINPDFALRCDAREFVRETAKYEWATLGDLNETRAQLDALYRGDLLADLYDEWIFGAREEYRQAYLDALLALTQGYRAQSEYARAIETARRVLQYDEPNERAHQHLMFCYIANGNRDAAVKQYEECVRALREELGVEPARETQQLYAWLKQVPSERAASEALLTNVPIPISSFVGRQVETAAVKQLFKSGARLVTLTGTGGSGKTRLAIHTATDLICENDSHNRLYDDGIWWVELAAIADAAKVVPQIAKTLGVRESADEPLLQTLNTFLQNKNLLLVFDNCEHVLDECVRAANELLTHCAGVSILATSREPLRIVGEHIFPVPTMRVPRRDAWSYMDLLQEYEGVRLFMERAQAIEPRFQMTEQNASAVAQICARLDGIPLALELAASRANSLSPQEIATRLDARFDLLKDANRAAPARHQTLRAVLDWSCDLLSERERVLFRRLSVFAGGCALDAAEQVCGEPNSVDSHQATVNGEQLLITDYRLRITDILDTLTHLVDKSLLTVTTYGTTTRYGMLETIREYARELLTTAGEESAIRARHLHYFHRAAQAAEPRLFETGEWSGLYWAETELDNLRAALAFALEPTLSQQERQRRATFGLEIMLHVWNFWLYSGYISEGSQWMSQLLAMQTQPSLARARAFTLAGDFARHRGDYVAEETLIHKGAVLARLLGDKQRIAWSVYEMGHVERDFLRYARAIRYFRKAIKLFDELNDRLWFYRSCFRLAETLMANGDLDDATQMWNDGLAWFRAQDNQSHVAWGLEGLGTVARLGGDFEQARDLYLASTHIRQRIQDRFGMTGSLEAFAQLAAAQGQFVRAAVLWGAAEHSRRQLSLLRDPMTQQLYASLLPRTREQLGAEYFESALARGAALSLDAAIQYALDSN